MRSWRQWPPQTFSTLFIETGSLWIWSVPNWLICLASLLQTPSTCSWLPRSQVAASPSQLFKWVLKFQTLVLTLSPTPALTWVLETEFTSFWVQNRGATHWGTASKWCVLLGAKQALHTKALPLSDVGFIFLCFYLCFLYVQMHTHTHRCSISLRLFNCLVNISSD